MRTGDEKYTDRRGRPERRAIILTAWIDDEDLYSFHSMRSRFYPKNRSAVSAHVTLFHHLPGARTSWVLEHVAEVVRDFRHKRLDAERGVARLGVTGVFRMQRGVAYRVERDLLSDLRAPMRDYFGPHLRPQDLNPWRNPHITVQNKVRPEDAARLERHLRARFEPCWMRMYGVQAWRYENGPWGLIEQFRFGEGQKA